MGDCCIPIIIICGSRSFIRRKEAPKDLAPLLKHVFYCHGCRCFRHADIFKRNDWFTLCFIPLFPCRLGPRYLGCDVCKRPMSSEEMGKACQRCGVVGFCRNRYCQTCGTLQDQQSDQQE